MLVNKETAKQAAQRLTQAVWKRGFRFEALHEYTDASGQSLFWRIRLKHPETGEKWVRPMCKLANGYQLQEPKFAGAKPLYNLPSLLASTQEPVIVCEGEQCADTLVGLGLLATTSGSADSASKTDWRLLSNRQVIIWPDNDEAGQHYAAAVAEILVKLDCMIKVIEVDKLAVPKKGDVVDWLKANPRATSRDIMALPMKEISETANQDIEEKNKKGQASELVDFVLSHAELFHDQNSEAYAQDLVTKETRQLNGRCFKDWLVSKYYQVAAKSVREQALREALGTLSGIARFDGECRPVYVRFAQCKNSYYLDLGQPGNSKVVEIKAGGWKMIDEPPVNFLRPNSMQPLPAPVSNKDLSLLWESTNIPENAKLLVITWLADCLRLDSPFPVLELIGEQGSAKSTTQHMLRQLIDPNSCNLRSTPKSIEDIFINANINGIVSYENVSQLSFDMQDRLCVIATGGGYAKRKLYTDADESVISVKRPIILNGISASVTSQDLVDRTLSIELPRVTQRIEHQQLHHKFANGHAQLLGAFLTIVSEALEILPSVELPPDNQPRLIEFAKLGMAVAKAMGESSEAFLNQFIEGRQEAIARTIDASPVATAVIEWFDHSGKITTKLPIKALHEQIAQFKSGNSDAWPKTPKAFADALRRAAPALRQVGIDCSSLGKKGSYVYWEVKALQ